MRSQGISKVIILHPLRTLNVKTQSTEKFKTRKTPTGQERTLIHKCLTHRKTRLFVLHSVVHHHQHHFTGHPRLLAALIGKGILIIQLIRPWSLSTVQFMMVKINGRKEKSSPCEKINCLTLYDKVELIRDWFCTSRERLFAGGTFTKRSLRKTFLSSSFPSDRKSSPARIVLRAGKTHNLASASCSINVLPVWQVHNRPAVYGCGQFGTAIHILEHFEEGDIWHSIKDFPERQKRERRSEVANCWILANMKREGRSCIIIIWTQNGLFMIIYGWWCFFVSPPNFLQSRPKLKDYTWIPFLLLLWCPVMLLWHEVIH